MRNHLRGLAVALLALGLAGCTDRDAQSVEDGLWYMFASHPKPKILKNPGPQLYCYETLGDRTCYTEPLPGEDD